MSHLYKCEEWEGGDHRWYVNDVTERSSASWWVPVPLFKTSYEGYVRLLKDKYHALCAYTAAANILIFSFDTQAEARKYKNEVNKLARQQNFIV